LMSSFSISSEAERNREICVPKEIDFSIPLRFTQNKRKKTLLPFDSFVTQDDKLFFTT